MNEGLIVPRAVNRTGSPPSRQRTGLIPSLKKISPPTTRPLPDRAKPCEALPPAIERMLAVPLVQVIARVVLASSGTAIVPATTVPSLETPTGMPVS